MHHLDQRLPGREARQYFLSRCLGAYMVDELLHHRQRDIGLQQRHAYFAQRNGHVLFRQATFAAETFECGL